MPTKVIRITDADPATGRLTLSDHGNTNADRTHKIIWQIQTSKVVSISIQPKPGAEDVWSNSPHPQGNHWEGDISPTARYDAEYCYSIPWVDTVGHNHVYDPKITIKPETLHDLIVQVVVAIIAAVVGFFTFRYFAGKKDQR